MTAEPPAGRPEGRPVAPGLCYVLMPFAPALQYIYDAIRQSVVDVTASTGIQMLCKRGDDTVSPGCVTREIVDSIHTAEIVIADLTGNNPNVFYELGIAHCLGNKTIMITQDLAALPFDVTAYRLIKYAPSPSGIERLRGELVGAMATILRGQDTRPNNPVQDFIPIRYASVIAQNKDLVRLEREATRSVWVIQPNFDTDAKLYADVIRENIQRAGIGYRYLMPDTESVRWGFEHLAELLAVDKAALERIQIRVVEPWIIESEIVIYDAQSARERVYLMSSPDDEHPFWYRIYGARARAIRDRYNTLWKTVSRPFVI